MPGPAEKSRFRLHLEVFAGMVTLLAGIGLQTAGYQIAGLMIIAATAICLITTSAAARRKRHEQLTERQRAILFGVEVTADVIIIAVLLTIALLRQTQLAWQVCGVLSAGVLLGMCWAYRKIYTDPAPPPVETEVDDEEERPLDSLGRNKG